MGPGETWTFYDEDVGSVELVANIAAAAGPGGRVYVPDTAVDVLYILRDLDQDGDANDAGEASVFFDQTNAEGYAITNTRSVDVDSDGVVYLVASPTVGTSAILRLVDTNDDGDANDPAEASIFFIESAGALFMARIVPDGTILAVLGLGTILRLDDADGNGVISGLEKTFFASVYTNVYEGLAQTTDGVVYGAVRENSLIWRFEDTNGDGTALGPGEPRSPSPDRIRPGTTRWSRRRTGGCSCPTRTDRIRRCLCWSTRTTTASSSRRNSSPSTRKIRRLHRS